jgi:colanic acid biosynthesis protein WcaH
LTARRDFFEFYLMSAKLSRPMLLSPDDFHSVVRLAPLVSIDLIIRNAHGEVLLGLRNNEPAKGFYFVPGGIIRKQERLHEAFARILKRETNCDVSLEEARLLGVYEHFYDANSFGDENFGTHYVVLAHELRLADGSALKSDAQHSEMHWWGERDLLVSDRVHENTKAYFRGSQVKSVRPRG